jgi:hypothetical protein
MVGRRSDSETTRQADIAGPIRRKKAIWRFSMGRHGSNLPSSFPPYTDVISLTSSNTRQEADEGLVGFLSFSKIT